jgi:hypothetical protein
VNFIRIALIAAVGACLAIASLAFVEAAQASDDWQVVSSSSDSSSWSTFAGVYGYEGTQARLTVRTSRRMRVKVKPYVSCSDVDYTTTVRRELAPTYRWVGPLTPLTRYYGPTFVGADSCSFSFSVTAGRGRLSAVLAMR